MIGLKHLTLKCTKQNKRIHITEIYVIKANLAHGFMLRHRVNEYKNVLGG